jgi:hypothetical protein
MKALDGLRHASVIVARLALVLLLTQCNKRPSSPTGVQLVVVRTAMSTPTNAVRITVSRFGTVQRNGQPISIDAIPECQRSSARSPSEHCILECDSSLTFESILPILTPMVLAGKRKSIVFAVRSGQGEGVLPLCVPVDWSPPGLRFARLDGEFNELGEREIEHIWIEVFSDPLEVRRIVLGRWSNRNAEIRSGETNAWPASTPRWGGAPADLQSWGVEHLRRYIVQREVSNLRPIVLVEAAPKDRIEPTLQLVSELSQIGAPVLFFVNDTAPK